MEPIDRICVEVGAARSATKFLGRLLSQHPDLAYWRRPKYIWRHGNAWKPDDCLTARDATPRIQRFIRRRFTEYMNQHGKQRLLVTAQSNVLALDFVNEVFPHGRVIHIIRDGREVAGSQRKEWEQHPDFGSVFKSRLPEVPLTDLPAYAGEFLGSAWRRVLGNKERYSFGPKIRDWRRLSRSMDRLEFCAVCWRECVRAARAMGPRVLGDRYLEVRFEELVTEPEPVVARMLEFMELPPAREVDDFVRDKINRGVAGKWFSRLSEDELQRIVPHMEDLLEELGYIK